MKSFSSMTINAPVQTQGQAGFTRIELAVVIATVLLLAMLILPLLGATRPSSKTFQCLNNLKQLITAWQMYNDDNHGRIVQNFHGGDAQGGAAANRPSNSPWAVGWLDWTTSPDNTNTLFLTSDRYSKLAQYNNHSAQIFKCPADVYVSAPQRSRNITRVRSVSASSAIGDGNAKLGPWEQIYTHCKKVSDLMIPGPADTFVYLDEHPDSINDPGFFSPRAAYWVNVPASHHNGAGNFAFADGHVETHRWTGSLIQPSAVAVRYVSSVILPVAPQDPDIHWVSYHSQRNTSRSY